MNNLISLVKKQLEGSKLQGLFVNENQILIQSFKQSQSCYFRICLGVPPIAFFQSQNDFGKNKKLKPLELFFKSHFVNHNLNQIQWSSEMGRVFKCAINNDFKNEISMEIRLIPGAANFILKAEGKQVSWGPVKDLNILGFDPDENILEFRSLEKIHDEWKELSAVATKNVLNRNLDNELEKIITKKEIAIQKIYETLQNQKQMKVKYYEVGEELKFKTIDQIDIPGNLGLDLTQHPSVLIEFCFEKAKSLSSKQEGALKRIEQLRTEISNLKLSGVPQKGTEKHKISNLVDLAVDVRKLDLGDSVLVFIGKNAKDNVKLLKDSRPWEMWFHLKDEPSAYAITRMPKNYNLSFQEKEKIGFWFVNEIFKRKNKKAMGTFDVVFTECRHVKQIKGDTLGRVSYREFQVIKVRI